MTSNVTPELAVLQSDIAALRAELERLRGRQRDNAIFGALVFSIVLPLLPQWGVLAAGFAATALAVASFAMRP